MSDMVNREELKKLIYDINEGLHLLHKQKEPVIYKNIKPSNIIKGINGNYMLADFGISPDDINETAGSNAARADFDYAAPETIMFNCYSPATDYYSFGITLYQLFTGKLPYDNSGDRLDLLMSRGITVSDDLGMPEDLASLIRGLTFYSHDPEINRKRWGYDEVKRWLDGDTSIELPAFQKYVHENVNNACDDQMPPFAFRNITYTDRQEFSMHWVSIGKTGKRPFSTAR